MVSGARRQCRLKAAANISAAPARASPLVNCDSYATSVTSMNRPAKRQRIPDFHQEGDKEKDENGVGVDKVSLRSLSRPVTPPLTQQPPRQSQLKDNQCRIHDKPLQQSRSCDNKESKSNRCSPRIIRSPVQLTHIRDFPQSSGNNVDTVRLRDILGDPMICECWQFNYCFDVDFIMQNFDEDVKDIVLVKIVHGSWKKDSPNRMRVDEACSRYSNVEAITAYMPEPFGTHHSKMMVLLRHDDLAQVIIHTANMIPGDWANMTQAVWQSPLLPLTSLAGTAKAMKASAFGSGERFKRDLLAYLDYYGNKRTGRLTAQLRKHDFTSVRASLIASVPSRDKLNDMDSEKATLWGWPALKDTIRRIPLNRTAERKHPHIVIQVSSIATLGQTDKWLKDTIFDSLSPETAISSSNTLGQSKFSIIYPTPDEIRRSLNGYASGGSIHMKLQSAAQHKQLEYLRQYFCHWAGDQENTTMNVEPVSSAKPGYGKWEAGRRRAAPHIKTYIQFSDKTTMNRIDWAMITSANLSTQAWGASTNKNGEVRICSWEVGVMVWPELIVQPINSDPSQKVEMVPCFKKDLPDMDTAFRQGMSVVGFRMPYDLPLTPYRARQMPWSATTTHLEPDWLGNTWEI